MLTHILSAIFIIFFALFAFPENAYAQYPTSVTCGGNGQGAGCNSTNDCAASCFPASGTCTGSNTNGCIGNCYCTSANPTCTCGSWGLCIGGYQTRFCDEGAGCNCASNPAACEYQIRTCTPEPTGPGGPGNTPTDAPVNTPVPTNTPIPVGDIRAQGFSLTDHPTTCGEITAGTSRATTFDLQTGGVSQGVKSQAAGSYAIWSNETANLTYTLVPEVLNAIMYTCRVRSGGSTTFGASLATTLIDGETVTYNIGYAPIGPWAQTVEGDVYAAGSIQSPLPIITPASARMFSLNGAGAFPGIVSYGNSNYDFSIEPGTNKGDTLVSSAGWLVSETKTPVNFWKFYYHKLGSPTLPDYTGTQPVQITKPLAPLKTTAYYVSGDATTSGNWIVNDGERIVILVDGNLTIGGSINIATTGNRTGFVAFIVHGDITIAPTVGTTVAGVSPNVEGVYIANRIDEGTGQPTAALRTSLGNAGRERLILKGIFIADSFALQRDLTTSNATTPSELFIYNPNLLVAMPDIMKDIPYRWEEVAP